MLFKTLVVTCFLQNVKLDCLLDFGASENFDKNVVDELRLKIFGANMTFEACANYISTPIYCLKSQEVFPPSIV